LFVRQNQMAGENGGHKYKGVLTIDLEKKKGLSQKGQKYPEWGKKIGVSKNGGSMENMWDRKIVPTPGGVNKKGLSQWVRTSK